MKKLIGTIVACLVVGTACAQESVVVDYSDLNLATSAGASALYRRIVNAAQDVCRRGSVLGLRGRSWHNCVSDAVTKAVADVDKPLVTARYHGERPVRLYSSSATLK